MFCEELADGDELITVLCQLFQDNAQRRHRLGPLAAPIMKEHNVARVDVVDHQPHDPVCAGLGPVAGVYIPRPQDQTVTRLTRDKQRVITHPPAWRPQKRWAYPCDPLNRAVAVGDLFARHPFEL